MNKNMKKDFVVGVLEFFDDFITSSKKSVMKLKELQEEFPEEYDLLKDMSLDPSSIEEIFSDLTEKEKETLLLILIKSSILRNKFARLFESKPEEKDKLIKEIDNFSETVKEKIKELNE